MFIVSNEAWGPQRFIKHHFACELARQGATVFFCDPVRGWRLSNLWRRRLTQVPTEEGVTVIRYDHPVPARPAPRITTRINDWVMGRRLRRLSGGRLTLLWQFDPFRFASNHFGKDSLKIYHVCDAYAEAPCDRQSADSADLIVCTSHQFTDHYRARYPELTVHVPLAIPASEHEVCFESVDSLRKRFGPYALCAATLDDRIDVSLLKRLANEFPRLVFVLAGPISGSPGFRAELAGLISSTNVFYEGVVPGGSLSSYIAGARLCLSAYRFDERTSLGPLTSMLKVMHYLAQKKAVVSSSPLEYTELEGRGIYCCATSDEYLDTVRGIVNGEVRLDREAVDDFLATRTYDQAVETILARLYSSARNRSLSIRRLEYASQSPRTYSTD